MSIKNLRTLLALAFFFALILLVASCSKDELIEVEKSTAEDIIVIDSTETQIKEVGIIVHSNFRNSTVPDKWINSGFIPTENGLQSPAEGGINTMIEYDQNSHLNSFESSFKFTMVSLSKVILTNYHKVLTNAGGHIVAFDFINGTIKVHVKNIAGALPVGVLAEEIIPFNVAPGKTMISYQRTGDMEKYTLVNNDHTFSFEYHNGGREYKYSTGQGYDKFGLVFLEGNIIVHEGLYKSNLPSEPDIFIVGDSIIIADLLLGMNGGTENRWASLVGQETLVAISALGGTTTDFVVRDLPFYFSLFKPNKMIFGVGVNDTKLDTYITNAEIFIEACHNRGIEPILQTITPRADRIQFCTDASNWIRNRGVRYIDFRKRLTVDGLGLVLKSELFLPDNLHPNLEGHFEMAQEAISTLGL